MDRRAFVAGAAAVAASARVWGQQPKRTLLLGGNISVANQAAPGPGQMAGTGSEDPYAWASECKRLGYRAGYCPPTKSSETTHLKAIRDAFTQADVVIAEVGAWRNLMTPDLPARKANLEFVIDQMVVANEIGARCCVDITGSFDAATLSGPHPKNFSQEFIDGTIQNVRAIIDAVKPTRSKFAIEMKGCNFPEGPDQYLQLIKAVDRPQFGVHVDICNIVNTPQRFYGNTALIRETFAKLGNWVVSCHAKDLLWVPQVNLNFQEVAPGRGGIKTANVPGIDYAVYIDEVVKVGAPLMLEHFRTLEEYADGAAYIRKVAASLHIDA